MNCLIFAVETSCDETAVALVRREEDRLACLDSEVASQIAEHRPFGGVVPEIATRQHLLHLEGMSDRLFQRQGLQLEEVDLLAVTRGPGLASSLLVGLSFVKGMAFASGKPWLGVNHLEGHLYSPFVSRGILPKYPHLGLIVSGGHTLLVLVTGPGSYEKLGSTLDDAVGESFDKVAKLLGLGYPGGPEVEKLAKEGNTKAYDFPRSMLQHGNFDFSFSGLKTAVRIEVQRQGPEMGRQARADVCASFQQAVIEILLAKTWRAAKAAGVKTITASGGVSCNGTIRAAFEARAGATGMECLFAPPRLSTDNAVMIAAVAAGRFGEGQTSSWDQDADPNLKLVQGLPLV